MRLVIHGPAVFEQMSTPGGLYQLCLSDSKMADQGQGKYLHRDDKYCLCHTYYK